LNTASDTSGQWISTEPTAPLAVSPTAAYEDHTGTPRTALRPRPTRVGYLWQELGIPTLSVGRQTSRLQPRRDSTRKRAPFSNCWVISVINSRRKELLVVTCNFLDRTQKPGRTHSQPVDRHDRNGVAEQFEFLETTMVSGPEGPLVVDSEVLVADLVGGQRLEFLGIEQHER
jgi:hypothetical protein